MAEEIDPVLQYYWDKAANVAPSVDPMTAAEFSYTAKSYYMKVDSDGNSILTDSALIVYFYTSGTLDSQVTLAGNKESFEGYNLTWPDVFQTNYHISFFPNDTGGSELTIGIDTDSTMLDQPDGIVAINREHGYISWLCLHYPNAIKVDRLSKTFWFRLENGFIVPDSVIELGARHGILSKEHFRIETVIKDVKVLR